jgi:hypothetical protein
MTLIALLVPPLAIAASVLVGVLGYLIDKNDERAERK